MKIITNNVPRDLLSWHELTTKEQAEFDYTNGDDSTSERFVRYKGETYDVYDTEGVPNFAEPGWDSFISETFFSGILFRFVDPENLDQVVVGRYYT